MGEDEADMDRSGPLKTAFHQSGGKVLAKKKEFRVNPGEMCSLTVDTAKLTGNAVTVEVVKED